MGKENLENLVKDYLSGMTAKEVGKKYNCSDDKVLFWVKKNDFISIVKKMNEVKRWLNFDKIQLYGTPIIEAD
jgi:uncharacterized protein YjcR